MGRWCFVRCSCPDRTPVDPARYGFGPYRCGHDDGATIQMSPNGIASLGHFLQDVFADDDRLFPVSRSIWAWRMRGFEADRLEIGGEQRDAWQVEAAAVRDWWEWGRDLEPGRLAYFERVLRPDPQPMTTFYQWATRRLVELTRLLHAAGEAVAVLGVLNAVDSLCEASRLTSNPVEFIY